ncbi:hypothetical protein HAX54_044587 [Datura stramonium]|uniref:Uncharacterized protein n=1 Tax=Datura stramonium TaxID=4076 RepID=A0ABS8WGW2_DATST|nr:hypothetical protein [Datura stramonium]
MALDGIIFEGAPCKVRRPSDYNLFWLLLLVLANQPKPQPGSCWTVPSLNGIKMGDKPLLSGVLTRRLMLQPGALATKVLCLTQVVEVDELSSLMNVVIPHPSPNGEHALWVGKVFLEYGDVSIVPAKLGKGVICNLITEKQQRKLTTRLEEEENTKFQFEAKPNLEGFYGDNELGSTENLSLQCHFWFVHARLWNDFGCSCMNMNINNTGEELFYYFWFNCSNGLVIVSDFFVQWQSKNLLIALTKWLKNEMMREAGKLNLRCTTGEPGNRIEENNQKQPQPY